MKAGAPVDFMMYVRAVPMLFRHLSILGMPVLAGVIDWALNDKLAPLLTDAVGDAGAGIFNTIAQIVYLFAFGVAVIQASNAWRGRKATFDEAWEEGRRKAGGILMASIGYVFVLSIAGYIGSILGSTIGLFLELAAAFFLIYTIPAAAIGGLPSQLALSGSISAVRSNVFGAAVLAVVFVALWIVLPIFVRFGPSLDVNLIATAAMRAIALAYLAFPFAKQYDDVAFRGFY
jgi:hypothetical protein